MARFRVISPLATAGPDADPEPLTIAYDGHVLVVGLGDEFDVPAWLPVEALEGQTEHYERLDDPTVPPHDPPADPPPGDPTVGDPPPDPDPAAPAEDTTTTVEE